MSAPEHHREDRRHGQWSAWAVPALAAIPLIAVSQSGAHYDDEGFHLLASSLVIAGKIPYRDFFYQHPPLFPYLYAGWMQIAGETWRSAHLLSAILSLGTLWMVARDLVHLYIDSRVSAAAFAFLLLALNPQFVWLGTVGHPYALCMFFSVLAYCFVVRGVRNTSCAETFCGGVAAGASVLASFLAVPLIPIMSIWILFQQAPGRRAALFAWFLAGAGAWLLPLAWFLVQAPTPVLFDLVEYHLHYRGPDYRSPPSGAFVSGLRQFISWARSWEQLAGSLLAMFGIWSLIFGASLDSKHRTELALAASLAGGLALFICMPYPTFSYYFVVLTPFACLVSYHGLAGVAHGGLKLRQWAIPLVLGTAIVIGNVLKPANRTSDAVWGTMSLWSEVERIAEVINRGVPRDAAVYASEAVYFSARRQPPRGMENSFGSELRISTELAASLNVALDPQVDEWIRSGRFAAVALEAADPRVRSIMEQRSRVGYAAIETQSSIVYFFPELPR